MPNPDVLASLKVHSDMPGIARLHYTKIKDVLSELDHYHLLGVTDSHREM